MTVSKTTTTLEKARELRKRNECWGELTPQQIANFADSLTAELQKENSRLREALEKIANTKWEYANSVFFTNLARAALSKEKK